MEPIEGRPSLRDLPGADSCGPKPNPVSDRAAYLRWLECKSGEGTKQDVDAERK